MMPREVLQRLAARDPAEAHPPGDAERDAHLHRTDAEHHDERRQQQDAGDRRERGHDEEHGAIHDAAEVPRGDAEEQRHRDDDERREPADQQRHARALERHAQHVAPEDVRAEQVAARIFE